MRSNSAKQMALGGIMAALAMVIMCLGGLIPFATFTCPMLCMLLLKLVLQLCGSRVAWAWYGAASLLAILMAPDKEAAAVFVFLGYYPILKPKMDRMRFSWLWKLVLFNVAILLMYRILIHLFGIAEIALEWEELGIWMTGLTLVLGNVVFFLLDKILSRRIRRRKRG